MARAGVERLQRLPNQFIPVGRTRPGLRRARPRLTRFFLRCFCAKILIIDSPSKNAGTLVSVHAGPPGLAPTRNKRFGPSRIGICIGIVHREMSVCLDESIT